MVVRTIRSLAVMSILSWQLALFKCALARTLSKLKPHAHSTCMQHITCLNLDAERRLNPFVMRCLVVVELFEADIG